MNHVVIQVMTCERKILSVLLNIKQVRILYYIDIYT